MNKLLKIAHAWLPAIAWMVFIFYLSSDRRADVSNVYSINFLFFKTLHVIFYGVLYFFIFRGFYISSGYKVNKNMYTWAFILAVLYGVTDEIHQHFVPGREGRPRDVFIDSIGIFVMYSYIRLHLSQFKKYFI